MAALMRRFGGHPYENGDMMDFKTLDPKRPLHENLLAIGYNNNELVRCGVGVGVGVGVGCGFGVGCGLGVRSCCELQEGGFSAAWTSNFGRKHASTPQPAALLRSSPSYTPTPPFKRPLTLSNQS